MVWNASHDGARLIRVDTLKRIHRTITLTRRTEVRIPRQFTVHRDYFQNICAAAKVPYNLRKVLEFIQEEFDRACDPIKFAATAHHRLMHVYPFRRNPGVTIRFYQSVLMSRISTSHHSSASTGCLIPRSQSSRAGSVGSRHRSSSVLLERSGTPWA